MGDLLLCPQRLSNASAMGRAPECDTSFSKLLALQFFEGFGIGFEKFGPQKRVSVDF